MVNNGHCGWEVEFTTVLKQNNAVKANKQGCTLLPMADKCSIPSLAKQDNLKDVGGVEVCSPNKLLIIRCTLFKSLGVSNILYLHFALTMGNH